MKKKRTRKRYETVSQINDDIERFKLKMKKYMDQANGLDQLADQLVSQGYEFSANVSYNREQAKKLRKSAFRIETVKLVQLKQKLAEFQTETLPGIVTDRSITR